MERPDLRGAFARIGHPAHARTARMRYFSLSAMSPTEYGPPGLAMTSMAPEASASKLAADPVLRHAS